MDNNIECNIICWKNMFDNYCNIINDCNNSILSIGEIKNNLTKLLGNQKKDDIIFYKSIIDNSYFYLTNSLKIRKSKFIVDLNHILTCINECKQIEGITKSTFSSIIKDYKRMADKINNEIKNNTILKWVKNDRIDSLHELDTNMYEVMNYHIKIISNLYNMIELEKQFYCSDIIESNIENKDIFDSTESNIENKDTSYNKIGNLYIKKNIFENIFENISEISSINTSMSNIDLDYV